MRAGETGALWGESISQAGEPIPAGGARSGPVEPVGFMPRWEPSPVLWGLEHLFSAVRLRELTVTPVTWDPDGQQGLKYLPRGPYRIVCQLYCEGHVGGEGDQETPGAREAPVNSTGPPREQTSPE